MSTLITTLLSILTGVCLAVGTLNLFIAWKSSNKNLSVTFASISFLLALHLIVQRALYLSNELQEFTLLSKLDMLLIPLIAIALVWYIAYYIQDIQMWALIGITIVNSFVIVINIFSPSSILYGSIISLDSVVMPWGEVLTMGKGTINNWHFLLDLSILLVGSFMGYAIYVFWKKGRYLAAVGWGISMMFIILAIIHDFLIVSGDIKSIYLFELAVLVFVFLMNGQLLRDNYRVVSIRKEIVENELKWRLMLDNINLIVLGLNRMGDVDYVNPYLLDLTGYEADEVIGGDWFDMFLPKTEANRVQSAFLEVLEKDFHPHYQNTIVTKAGKEIRVNWFNVRYVDGSGRMQGSLSIGVEIPPRPA